MCHLPALKPPPPHIPWHPPKPHGPRPRKLCLGYGPMGSIWAHGLGPICLCRKGVGRSEVVQQNMGPGTRPWAHILGKASMFSDCTNIDNFK